MNIHDMIGNMTEEQTKKLAAEVLDQLQDNVARRVIVTWAIENDMAEELIEWLQDRLDSILKDVEDA